MLRWRTVLDGGALTTQTTLDEWYEERTADVDGLATTVALHSMAMGAGGDMRELGRLLRPLGRRGKFVEVWIVDSTGAVLASAHGSPINDAEHVALVKATRSRVTTHSALMLVDSAHVFLSLASPVRISARSTSLGPHIPAAVLARISVVGAFAPWAAGRPNAAMSLFVTPSPRGAILVAACPPRLPPVCVSGPLQLPAATPAALALARQDTFGIFPGFDRGGELLAATRFDTLLEWGVVRRVARTDAFVPLWREVALESAFLAAFLALGFMGLLAANRTARAHRLHEQSQADQRLVTAVNASTDGLLSVDASFNVIMANLAVERLFGVPESELLGRPVLSLFAPESHASFERFLQQFAREGLHQLPSPDIEHSIALRADGVRVPVDTRLGRSTFDGRPLYTLGVRDVSERARTELFLQGQRQVLELIASGAPADEALGVLIEVVEAEAPEMHFAAYELEDDAMVARLVSAPSLQPDFIAATNEIVVGPESAAVGTAVHRAEPVYAADIATDPLWLGSRSYVLSFGWHAGWAMPLRAANGDVIGALACYYAEPRGPTLHELELASAAVHLASIALSTARDAAALRESEASFRSFVENAPAAIFRETRYGRLVTSNPAMISLLRYRSVDALLEAADEGQLYHRHEAREELRRALERSDVVQGVELEWRRADGSLVTVRVSARAYRDDRGELWLWEGYAEDITQLRAAELALRHNEKLAAVGQLISGVAHELNNPLSSIMHFTEDLLADTRTPQDAEALSVIRDQARRSRSIVRDLLSFVHQRDARAEPILVADVVAATVRVMRPTMELSGAHLHVSHSSTDIVVLGDGGGIEQVITNLLSNAMHAAGHGGDVWLRTEGDGTSCRLVIEDSGAGIPDEIRARIFDPFFTTKPTGEGTGLGLSVTLGIVEQLGGRIEIESRAPSAQGTRVTVTLPRTYGRPAYVSGDYAVVPGAPSPHAATADCLPATALAELAATAKVQQRRALIIDDEATIRSALRRFFVRRGWDAEEAPDGAAGLRLLEDHGARFDVVISDLRMPGFSGVELHDQLVTAHPALLRRIVFSTGDVASREAAVFVQRTSCHVLQKPFELKTLDEIVGRILAATAAERVVT